MVWPVGIIYSGDGILYEGMFHNEETLPELAPPPPNMGPVAVLVGIVLAPPVAEYISPM